MEKRADAGTPSAANQRLPRSFFGHALMPLEKLKRIQGTLIQQAGACARSASPVAAAAARFRLFYPVLPRSAMPGRENNWEHSTRPTVRVWSIGVWSISSRHRQATTVFWKNNQQVFDEFRRLIMCVLHKCVLTLVFAGLTMGARFAQARNRTP